MRFVCAPPHSLLLPRLRPNAPPRVPCAGHENLATAIRKAGCSSPLTHITSAVDAARGNSEGQQLLASLTDKGVAQQEAAAVVDVFLSQKESLRKLCEATSARTFYVEREGLKHSKHNSKRPQGGCTARLSKEAFVLDQRFSCLSHISLSHSNSLSHSL
jgi:hypothetical protein